MRVGANLLPRLSTVERQNLELDIASIYELDKVMDRGVSADRISYGNTIKKSSISATSTEKGRTPVLHRLQSTCAISPVSRWAW